WFAAKLPILSPNEFDLWKMIIEQYFLMTDYSLWEQRLAKKNELKAKGTLLMALPDKHQLNFNIHKDAKSLMEAIEKRFCGNKETKKIYEAEVKSSSSTSPTTQNITFVSSQNTDSTNESVSDVTSVSAASTKVLVFDLPNMDNLSDAIIYSFFAKIDLKWQMAMLTMRAKRRGHFTRECRSPRDTMNKDTQSRNVPVETSTSNALVSQCDGVGSYDWSFQADEEPTNYALMAFTSSSSSGFDSEVAPCSKTCSKAYATLQSQYDQLTNELRKSQFDVLSYKSGLESVKARLVVYQRNKNMFEEDIKLLKLDVMLRDNALVEFRKKFEKLNKKEMMFNSTVFDCDELISSESDVSMPTSPVHDMYKSREGCHVVPPPYTGTFIPPKPYLVFHDAPTTSETVFTVLNVEPSTTKPNNNLSQSNRPSAPIIKDWVFDSEDASEAILTRPRLVPLTAARHVTTAVSQTKVQHQRPTKHGVNKAHLPIKRPINLRPSPKNRNFHQKVTTVKANQVNDVQGIKGNWIQVSYGLGPQKTLTFLSDVYGNPYQALKDKGVIDSGCSRHMTVNISYLSDFEKLIEDMLLLVEIQKVMCDKKNIVLFTDTECVVLFSDFKLPDENHVLLRVLREKNMYNVNLENIVPSGDLTCLFAKATLDESNIWHRRLGHINFKTMNKLVKRNLVRGLPSKVFENNHTCVAYKKGTQHRASFVARNQPNSSAGIQDNFDAGKIGKDHVSTQKYVLLPLWSTGSKDPQNIDDDVAFADKENASEVHVSPSNLSDDFEEFSVNSTNRVIAASTPVTAVGPNSTNSTNNFNVVGPSNTAVSPTFEIGGKSSFVDPSEYPYDPDMPALEDITYSNDEEDVGAEADYSNLETNITVSPIPTTRVHKDHPVTQIMGDLSLTPQTRGMKRMVKEQGGQTQIYDEDFHTCMFACFLYQEEPKRVHQALKDPSWNEVMQEELLQFKMQKEEGIDYEEVFDPVARIEAIRLFLAYASFMRFMVYQMNVKSAFLYGTIKEEVYVCQPLGFEDPDYPDKVYKVVKVLYGLHQAPRAWYETLANYLLESGFQKGKIDQTLFIKKQTGDIMLVYVYVDEIIFGSTNKELCKAFEKLMKDKFQMSSMGKVTLFLGLQVKQKPDGIFISQDKYLAKILRKFGLTEGKSASTPIDTRKPLLKDPDGEDVDVHIYRSMIGSLMYLTSSRPDIMFAVCACAHFQVTLKALHLHAVKRIFRYLKGKPHLGLWYPKDSPFNLVAYSDCDYVGASLDRKSTIGGCQFLGCRLISWQCKKTVVATSSTEAEYVAAASCCAQVLWIQNYPNFNLSLFIIPTIIMALTFADTHNVIAFLTKSDASERFEQIIDFLNAQVIQYALIVKPIIYVLCIKQFWSSISIKMSNDVVRLQAQIDRKNVVITEDSIRQALRLDDADGVDCLPNEEIFAELARM
nr:hypothetical protein [Tanacetum cinerariifolium]